MERQNKTSKLIGGDSFMNFKKVIAFAAVAALSTGLLAGCGGSKEAPKQAQPQGIEGTSRDGETDGNRKERRTEHRNQQQGESESIRFDGFRVRGPDALLCADERRHGANPPFGFRVSVCDRLRGFLPLQIRQGNVTEKVNIIQAALGKLC
jgi:hypothetical protein